MFEYIKSLAELQQSPNAFLSEFVAQLYYDSGRIGELTMLLQHGLLQESVMLAKIILKNANNDSQFFQLGLDILKRLHEDEEVILELQSRKLVSNDLCCKNTQSHDNVTPKLLESLRYATQFNCIHFISPSKILEDSYRSGNKTLFLNVYKWLEELGLIPIDFEQPRSTNGDMMRYISIFREIWGEVVDMEPVNLFE